MVNQPEIVNTNGLKNYNDCIEQCNSADFPNPPIRKSRCRVSNKKVMLENRGACRCISVYLNHIPEGLPFSTRLFLQFGKRAIIDQYLYQQVKRGRLVRLARGIFMRKPWAKEIPEPSVYEIAKIKADAFGKQIFINGVDAGAEFGLIETHDCTNIELLKEPWPKGIWLPQKRCEAPNTKCLSTEVESEAEMTQTTEIKEMVEMKETREKRTTKEIVFITSGKTTSFMCGSTKVIFKQMTPRYIHSGDSYAGLMVRTLLHLGKYADISTSLWSKRYEHNTHERLQLQEAIWQMPSWMSDVLARSYGLYGFRRDRLRFDFSSSGVTHVPLRGKIEENLNVNLQTPKRANTKRAINKRRTESNRNGSGGIA